MFKISPEYFHAAGTALLSGRGFTLQDDKDNVNVAVVNREFALKIFGSVPARRTAAISKCPTEDESR